MMTKFRLTSLILALVLCCGLSLQAQDTNSSKVVVKTTYEDSEGKKHSETKEFIGEAAEKFDPEAYVKDLEEKGFKILTVDVSKEVEMSKEGLHEDHDVKIIKKKGKESMEKKKVMIKKMKEGDSTTYEIEEKDGKVFVNGEEVEGKNKRIKVIKTDDDEMEMNVEVKDGKVFINGEEVEDVDEDVEKHVIINKSGGSGANIWISDDNEVIDLEDMDGEMIFISEDMDDKPRMGIMIEDGKEVNGAAVVDLVEDSPASKAGLMKGDVVTAINDTKVYGATSLMSAMDEFSAGDEVKVTYNRGGKSMTSTMKLEKLPHKMHKKIEKKIIKEKEDKK